MRTEGGFVVRLVLYAVGVGIAFAIARAEWAELGLDAVANGGGPAAGAIARWADRLPVVLSLGTFLLAALGSVSRLLGTLLVWALIAAIITAPFAIARAAGG